MLHQYLPNGVEVALKENHFAKMVAIQVWVGVGSLFESDKEGGLSHLIEHMLFKGTARRAVGEISRTVEACGGDMNAYTTFDRTVYYLTLSSQHAEIGLDLLADAVFESAFDQDELTKEKEVVIEEIRRSLDNPASQVGRKIFEQMYQGTTGARPIIGYEETVAGFTRQDVVSFHKKWYRPDNMAVVAVGDFETAKMEQWIQQRFGAATGSAPKDAPKPLVRKPAGIKVELLKKDFKQPRLEMAFPGPSLTHFDMAAIDLVAFGLGAGEAARLNRTLRDQEGVASSVGCSLYSPTFGGIFELSSLPFHESYLDTVRGLARELSALKYNNPITDTELERARANLKSDRVYQEESVSGQARTLGFGLTTDHKTLYEDVFSTTINHITPAHIQSAVDRWVDENAVVIVGMVPKESTITEDDIKKAYLAGIEEGKAKAKAARAAAVTKSENDYAPTITKLQNGVTFVYRQNPNCELFTLVASTEGGLRADEKAVAGRQYAMGELLGLASTSRDYEEILSRVEGTGAVLQGFSGKDSLGFKIQCLQEKHKDMLAIWADCFLNPVFPEEQWERIKREVQEMVESEADSPFHAGVRQLQEKMFGDHPYRYPLYGNWDRFQKFKTSDLLNEFTRYRDGGQWIIGCVSNLPVAAIKEEVEQALAAWRPSQSRRTFASNQIVATKQEHAPIHVTKDREQTHILIGFRGLAWNDRERGALDIMTTILGGSGGRLFLKLRDEQSLAYTVTPIVSYGCHAGMIGAYIACAPEKVPVAKRSLLDEFQALCKEPPTAAEVERAKNYIIGSHESDLQRSEAQAMTMALMEAYGFGYDDFLKYPAKIAAATAKDVQAVAIRLMQKQSPIVVSVGTGDGQAI